VFVAVFLHEFNCDMDTATKCVNFKAIIPEDHPIPELFLILLLSHLPKIIPT